MTTTAPEPAGVPRPAAGAAAPEPLPEAAPGTGSETPAPGSDPRCGYPKKDGTPCRNRVPEQGKVCRVHQKAALLDRILAGRKSAADPNAT